jgi:hypothetical protein
MVGERDLRAFAREGFRNRRADSPTPAGNQGDATLELARRRPRWW